MSKYRNTIFCDYQSRFLVIFSKYYRHRLVLKIPFSDHIFPRISTYRTENLHFPSTSKYYAPFFSLPQFMKNGNLGGILTLVVWVNGVSSSKQQNEKFEVLWFENCRVLTKKDILYNFNKLDNFLIP